jgi:hypothetical protein
MIFHPSNRVRTRNTSFSCSHTFLFHPRTAVITPPPPTLTDVTSMLRGTWTSPAPLLSRAHGNATAFPIVVIILCTNVDSSLSEGLQAAPFVLHPSRVTESEFSADLSTRSATSPNSIRTTVGSRSIRCTTFLAASLALTSLPEIVNVPSQRPIPAAFRHATSSPLPSSGQPFFRHASNFLAHGSPFRIAFDACNNANARDC